MSPLRLPLQLLLTMFAGWINRQQLDVLEYLKEENRLLKERMGGRRIRFTDAERRRLAREAQVLGRKVLSEIETLVTPDTLLRWHRQLVAAKWNFSHRRGPGRPRALKTLVDLIPRMAHENPAWGYMRIRGALVNLGHDVGRGTIANILSEHGIEPAPKRDKHTSWSTFLKAHADRLAATDFPTARFVEEAAAKSCSHHMQFRFAHRSFQAEQEPIIEVRRIVNAILVNDQDIGECTDLQQSMPELRARRETSSPSPITIPACPRLTSVTRR